MDDSNKNKLTKLENLNKFKEFIIEKIISPITTNITNLQKSLENKAEKTHNHDSSYLKLSGGSMTGNLSFSSTNGQGVKFWRNTDEFGIYVSKADDETYGGRLWESTSDYNMYFKMGTKSHGFVFKNGNTILGGMDGSGEFRAKTKISTTDIYFGGENVNNQGRFENGELTFANAKGIYGKDSNGAEQRIAVISDACYLGGVNLHTYIRSPDCPQYLDSSGNKYNIYHSGNFNPANYLPLTGGTLTGDITLSNSKAIKGKNNSGTAQDLIKLGTYATSSGSTQATIVGNSNYPTISLGSLYEGNYRVLNSNNFTSYCPSISDLDNYLNKSGGTITGELALTQDKGIISANADGGTLLIETSSSVNVGKTTKNLNLNCSLAYMNGARVLTEYNYTSYTLPKLIYIGNIPFDDPNGVIHNSGEVGKDGYFTPKESGTYLILGIANAPTVKFGQTASNSYMLSEQSSGQPSFARCIRLVKGERYTFWDMSKNAMVNRSIVTIYRVK